MQSRSPFLTARWVNLGLVSYEVHPEAIAPHLPPGCEPDLRDGHAFVSLVAFDFLDTRVRGLRWPGLVNFPEVNLRFYVRHGGRRGVSFIRELVPSRLIAWVARTLYHEPYLAVPMRSRLDQTADRITLLHEVLFAGKTQRIRIDARSGACDADPGGVEHFFKEHEFGFGRCGDAPRLVTYRVRHPVWQVYRDPVLTLDWDFAAVYGSKWGFLNGASPCSVVLAAGSEVAVYPRS